MSTARWAFLTLCLQLAALEARAQELRAAEPASQSVGNNPFLEQARQLYRNLEYEACLERIAQAPQLALTPSELVEVELYGGLCSVSLGDEARAKDRFLMALRLDRTVKLPSSASPKVVELFEAVRSSLPPPAAPPSASLTPAASSGEGEGRKPSAEAAVTHASRSSPARPWVVGGLAGVGAIAATGGVLFGRQAQQLGVDANAARFPDEARAHAEGAQHAAMRANVAWAVAGAAVVGAVVSWFLFAEDSSDAAP